MLIVFFCVALVCNIRVVAGIDFSNHNLSTDFSFTSSNSPYYIHSTVHFTDTSNVIIENGVEIIFNNSDAFIQFDGSLNCGCNNMTISNVNKRGLSDLGSFVYLHTDNDTSNTGNTKIVINNTINTGNIIKFCNTKFDSLFIGINIVNPGVTNVMINNCEFNNIYSSVLYSEYNTMPNVNKTYLTNLQTSVTFKNSITRNVYSIQTNYFGKIEYSNSDIQHEEMFCDAEFDGYGWGVCYDYISIINSKISSTSTYNDDCLGLSSIAMAIIRNNTIVNCSRYGIRVTDDGHDVSDQRTVHISDNTFRNVYGTAAIVITPLININIINNIFIHNNVSNIIWLYPFYTYSAPSIYLNVTIENNTFIHNYVRFYMIHISGNINGPANISLSVDIKQNAFLENYVSSGLIFVFGPKYHFFSVNIYRNLFQNNIALSTQDSLIYSNVNTFNLIHNMFVNNTLATDYMKFLFVVIDMKCNYNTFDNTFQLWYLANLDAVQPLRTFLMEYNIFYYSLTINIDSNIAVESSLNIRYNNFYELNETEWIVSDFSKVPINAERNYFDGVINIYQISSKFKDYCNRDYRFLPLYPEPIDFDNITDSFINYSDAYNLICFPQKFTTTIMELINTTQVTQPLIQTTDGGFPANIQTTSVGNDITNTVSTLTTYDGISDNANYINLVFGIITTFVCVNHII